MLWLNICISVVGLTALALMLCDDTPPDPTHNPAALKERPDDY